MTTPAPNDDLVRRLRASRYAVSVEAASALEAQAERISVLERALEPSAETKAAYSGEFYERVEVSNPNFDEDDENEPETLVQQVPISWTTIKEIMAAIRSQATPGAR